MSRYRPPQAPASPYITAAGYRTLQLELQHLWQRRAEVTQALAAAAAEGDRSENAEYIYRKKELREIDRRIRYLQKRLPELSVVDQPPADREGVFFGAWVTLIDDHNTAFLYRIVGSDEIGHHPGYISLDAPLARALLKKRVGDDICVETPQGSKQYCIDIVNYDNTP